MPSRWTAISSDDYYDDPWDSPDLPLDEEDDLWPDLDEPQPLPTLLEDDSHS